MDMEHLDTFFLSKRKKPSCQEHQEETLCLGVKLQVCQQKKRKLLISTRRTEEKKGLVLPSLKHYVWRVVEAEVLSRGECRQGDSSAVWGQLQVLERIMEGEEHGRRKEAFHTRGGLDLCAWVYGRSSTKNPKGRMFKKVLLLVKGKIHCHYH